nr:PLD nuclease N-terminal domain-containing protein [Kineosporia babensis]
MIFCLIECIQTDSDRVRNLPKVGWILLILFFPIVGGIAWLVAGRPKDAAGNQVAWRSTGTAGFPEYERPQTHRAATDAIDEQLRRDQERVDREHDEALRKWRESRGEDPGTEPQKP